MSIVNAVLSEIPTPKEKRSRLIDSSDHSDLEKETARLLAHFRDALNNSDSLTVQLDVGKDFSRKSIELAKSVLSEKGWSLSLHWRHIHVWVMEPY